MRVERTHDRVKAGYVPVSSLAYKKIHPARESCKGYLHFIAHRDGLMPSFRLSADLPDVLLVSLRTAVNAVTLVGLRSGLPKTHPVVLPVSLYGPGEANRRCPRSLEPQTGFAPATCALQVRCSTC